MKILVFLFSLISLLACLIFLNPMLIGRGRLDEFLQDQVRNSAAATVVYEEALKGGSTQFTYRGNGQRSGNVKVGFFTRQMELETAGSQVNYGIHTASKSSVAVDSSGYYVGGDEGKFDAYDSKGQLKWSFNTISSLRGIHGTAATDELYVYIGNYRGHLYCVRKSDGKLMWDTVLADAIGTAPLLVGEFLYVTAEFNGKGAFVSKVSRRTGEKIWTSTVFGEQSHSSPALSKDGRIIVVGDNAGVLWGIHSQNGERVWNEKVGGEIKGTPLIVNENVFLGTWEKKFCSYKVNNGEKNWCRSVPGAIQASAALDPISGDIVIQTANKPALLRFRPKDGSLVWQKNFNVDTRIGISSPVVLVAPNNSSQLLMGCDKKALCLLDIKSGNLISSLELPNTYSSVPTVFNDQIFLSLDKGGIVKVRLK